MTNNISWQVKFLFHFIDRFYSFAKFRLAVMDKKFWLVVKIWKPSRGNYAAWGQRFQILSRLVPFLSRVKAACSSEPRSDVVPRQGSRWGLSCGHHLRQKLEFGSNLFYLNNTMKFWPKFYNYANKSDVRTSKQTYSQNSYPITALISNITS